MKNILLIIMLLASITLQAQQKITYIKLNKTSCKGKCPVYSVELNREGAVTWHGIRNVSRKGYHTAQLSKKEAKALFAEFEKNDLTKLRKRYTPVAGKQPLKFEFEIAGHIVSIENAEGGPEYLQKMAARIDQKIKNLPWKPLRFVPPVVEPENRELPTLQDINLGSVESNEMDGVTGEAVPVYDPPVNNQANEALTYAEEMPEFPGGTSALMRFMQMNLRYPDMAREMGISGKVYCRFVVDEQGEITDVKVLKGIGHGLDQEAVRVVKMMPRWIPGKMNKKPVKVQYVLPVKFVLN